MYNHLQYQGAPWYTGKEDGITLHGPITTTTFLPPGRYMIVTASYGQITNFSVTGSGAQPGTVVANYAPGEEQPQNFLGTNIYGSVDGHAVYLLEYYSQTVVGSASGGFGFNGAPVIGGPQITVDYPLSYTITYGDVPPDANDGGPDCTTCSACNGMTHYSINQLLSALVLTDTPISYSPPRGPSINFTLTYNSRANQPGNESFPNLGPQWTFNWLSYVVDDPANPQATKIYLSDGKTEVPGSFDSGSQTYAPDPYSTAVLAKTGTAAYERKMPDGSKFVYDVSDGASAYPRKIFLSQWIDAAGQAATLTYDNDRVGKRLKRITDALGVVNTDLHYDDPNNDRHITSVTNTLGKTVLFTYDAQGRLTDIQDPVGIVSHFDWQDSKFINQLTTPYGSTQFSQGGTGTNLWLQVTDPLGGVERVEYRDNAPGIPSADPANTVPGGFSNSGLDVHNSFYWDKKATLMYPPDSNGVYDYTKARITHWMKTPDGKLSSRVAASTKSALENRVWNAYLNQPDPTILGTWASPTKVARVLDDGTTQLSQYDYNSIGKVTNTTDPSGRVTGNVYDTNNIDLLTVYQRNPAGVSTDPSGAHVDQIASFTYDPSDPPHLPRTYTDAAGQVTTYRYNSSGQLTSVQNARGEKTTYLYSDGTFQGVPNGYLASVTSPIFNNSSAVTSFTYDSANRVRTVTNSPDNYTVTTDYDNLDRPATISYPDGTNQQFRYTKFVAGVEVTPQVMTLDLGASKDRRGHWTYREYDANRHLTKIKEHVSDGPPSSVDRITQYVWCTCGSLANIIDPLGHTTTLNRDLQSRVYQKVYADSTSVSYTYENSTSRLKSMTDALNQTTNYQYFADDNLQQVTYTNAQQPTPNVSFTYDPNYNRIRTMMDGNGTTTYDYYPVNPSANPPILGATNLRTEDGPLPNDTITYSYDELGRHIFETINSFTSEGNTFSRTYDSLGRISRTGYGLFGEFDRLYEGPTARLREVDNYSSGVYPPGVAWTHYSYFGNSHDRRLQTIFNYGPYFSLLSRFDYTYDAEGQIQSWTKQIGTTPGITGNYSYDLADELVSGTTATVTPPASFAYTYDLAGNRTTDQQGTGVHMFNNVNQTTDAGYTYDSNGNLTSDGSRKYFWDAANRLAAIETAPPLATAPTHKLPPLISPPRPSTSTPMLTRSEFSYDGLGRRTRIVEKQAGSVGPQGNIVWTTVGDHRDVWKGNELAEERDGSNPQIVTKCFYPEGEIIGPINWSIYMYQYNYYYTRDHVGSVREMVDNSGTIRAEYEYDPYGNRTKLSGDLDADFGFTGFWHHSPSGLDLSLYRAYSSTLGRWISRDRIGEAGGINLYSYVRNNPPNWIDPKGLDVYVGEHRAVFPLDPYSHTAIVLSPDNPADFAGNPLFNGSDIATLGAQPSDGLLVSAPNYPGDNPGKDCKNGKLKNLTLVPTPPGMTDTEFINALINAANSYQNNLPYASFPSDGTYNSNGYTSGLLYSVGAVAPPLPGSQPGYNHPIPLP